MANVVTSRLSDGTNTGYFASQAYFVCSTAADTAAKVATSPDSVGFSNTSRVRGTTVHVKFTNANTASSPTLQVGTSTAASIVGNAAWSAGTVVSFTFDGTSWIQNDITIVGGYLVFSSSSAFTLSIYNTTKNWDGTLEYSTDRFNWTIWDGTTTLSAGLRSDGKYYLYLRGTGNTAITGRAAGRWALTGSNISCSGNIENLLDYQIVARGEHPTMSTLCYGYMFQGCTSLTTAPELPDTTLAGSCYYSMFNGCTSLTSAPELPATTLTTSCYESMFYGCTSLVSPPELPATTLKTNCYGNMFKDCTSLVTPPVLPATTLANNCYSDMFNGCTSLTAVPALPATALAGSCYSFMFFSCSLIKLSTTQTGEYQIPYRIPLSSAGTAGSESLSVMFGNTGGTFKSTPSINTTYYLSTSNSVIYPDTYIEYTPNKVTTIDSNSTDLQYPSAKAVYDLFTSITDADSQSY